jgi:serine/threonine protein kinase
VLRELSGNLGSYRLGDALGTEDGYGAAFTALRDDDLRCVVKLIHGFVDPSLEVLGRLQTTLEHLSLIRSDHVVPIIDAGVDRTAAGALPWIAMELIPGARSLREVIADAADPLGPRHARRIGAAIALGLVDLHASRALHRDLTPDHVLIGRDGRPKLIAFELAKIQDLTSARRRPAEREALYMAPEQLGGAAVPETDLWALGLVLAEMLTGRQPVQEAARSRADVRRVIATESLVPSALPDEWRALLEMLLRKVPSSRPAGARSVADWLAGHHQLTLRNAFGTAHEVPRSPRWRWSVKSRDDVAAVEASAGAELRIAAIDASGRARSNRLRRATRAIPAPVGFEPDIDETSQLSFDDPSGLLIGPGSDVDRDVIAALTKQRDADTDHVLLPWRPLDAAGFAEAIEVLRIGMNYSGLAGSKPVIATVHLPAGALTRTADALELSSVLCALKPSGWRLFVEGLQPRCGPNVLNATVDMAAALATRAEVWVRAGGLARWPLVSLDGVSVIARSGRGLWTRGGGIPHDVPPERVEVPLLAGPVPRIAAERLAHARPEWLACDCSVCAVAGGLLPAHGYRTIVHNVNVIDGQLATLLRTPAALRPEDVSELLAEAMARRATLPRLIGWHCELEDLQDVLSVLNGVVRSRRSGHRLLRFA